MLNCDLLNASFFYALFFLQRHSSSTTADPYTGVKGGAQKMHTNTPKIPTNGALNGSEPKMWQTTREPSHFLA